MRVSFELTLRVIILSLITTIVLAISNTYLALKLGMLTSASIPAAIISMGILRLFKNSTILENNLVQTAASAGEAIAGGIVYTIPALVIIGYWQHFAYWPNFFIAFCSGTLGIIFSIPLRRILVHDNNLKFPEGRAVAELLKSSWGEQKGIVDVGLGAAIGAIWGLAQTGFKVLAGSWYYWWSYKRLLFGIGAGFSITLIGAGYLIGQNMAFSIFFGALITLLIVPVISYFDSLPLEALNNTNETAMLLWDSQIRYIGIGAMLCAGLWTLSGLIRPLGRNIFYSLFYNARRLQQINDHERDISSTWLLIGIILIALGLFIFFHFLWPLEKLNITAYWQSTFIFGSVFYILITGFIFAVISAYFSGMVGVTASPGSAILIAGIIFAASILLLILNYSLSGVINQEQITIAEAVTIIISSIITGIAAIANDNMQDLKIGQLVGATPWKQEFMLVFGVLIAALIIPWTMELLFQVYGIAGANNGANVIDAANILPAPTAAVMAAITKAVFSFSLPWLMLNVGVVVILLILLLGYIFSVKKLFNFSILGIAMGMYLPISSSFSLFFGGVLAFFINYNLKKKKFSANNFKQKQQQTVLIACGIVAGAAVVDVLLAIPFVMYNSANILSLTTGSWNNYGSLLSILLLILLAYWLKRRLCREKDG